jgi:tetratricopeptide (TPR) repeat protein
VRWEHFPARVEGVIEKRIGRLPAELRDLVTIGSVQGESFFAEIIAEVRGIDARELTRRLSAELDRRHRLIREQGVKHIGKKRMSQYRFRHHLFQKYLYGRLAAAERMYLHEDVGLALEALYADNPDANDLPTAQLARHFQEARLSEKASQYRLLAGKGAARLLAFDEAVAQFEGGLLLLENVHRNRETSRLEFELTLALGRAYWHGGRVAESLPTLERSIELARTLDVPDAMARAALAYEEPRARLILDVERSQRHMREALATLGEEDSPLRVRLMVFLSRGLLVAGAQEELGTTLVKALTMARQIDDPVALCDALRISAEIDRRPETTAARLAAIEEMIAVARSIGDRERLSDALCLYIYDHLELGDIDVVDDAIEKQKRVAEEIKQPFQLHIAAVFETMRAIMRGEFEKAERLALAAFDISRQLGIADLDGIIGIQMFSIRWQQGRLNEVAPIVKLYAAGNTFPAAWRPGLALICAALDLRDECRAVFEELVTDTLAFAPQDSLRVTSLAYLTEACAYLGDGDRAKVLYDLLLPYDGRAVVVGGATACYGAAARYLGMLAATLNRWDAAERHFQGAIELDARMGARPWLANSQCEYAAMLLTRGKAEDRPRASELLAEAQAAANAMGMANLREKVSVQQAGQEFA